MADYDFSRLSAREFQHLIQALCTKVFGIKFEPMGDGADGGRDGTHHGQVRLPESEAQWDGYTILQVKTAVRPKETESDGRWLARELEGEIATLRLRPKEIPSYYVLATNVYLSPAPPRTNKRGHRSIGGLERISTILRRPKNKGGLGLKDFQIWHADKVRALLDAHRDVAASWSAWITPSQVLNVLMAKLAPSADFKRVMNFYIQRELRRDQFARLDQAGQEIAEVEAGLSKVFVDLPIRLAGQYQDSSDQTSRPGIVSTLMELANAKLDRISQDVVVRRKQSGAPSSRFVIIGGPGQGKSTIAQYISQIYRAHLCAALGLLQADSRRIRSDILEGLASQKIEPPTLVRFPFRVDLPTFAKYCVSCVTGGKLPAVLSYVAERISTISSQHFETEDLRKWLSLYPWIIVFDGLDEVPASSNRDNVIACISDFWDEVEYCSADVVAVVTTRPQGYNNELKSSYLHLELAPLTPSEALTYAGRLIPNLFPTDPERQAITIQKLKIASANSAVARLLQTPLQVTIMSALVARIGEPPQDRWQLFSDYYRVVYDRELGKGVYSLLRDRRGLVDLIHHRTGMVLQARSERSGGTDALLSHDELKIIVSRPLTDAGFEGEELNNLVSQFITAAKERLVFLTGRTDESVGYEVRSLQEFMAGEAIVTGLDSTITQRLYRVGRFSHWRNVFLFVAGKFFAAPDQFEHFVGSLITFCRQLNQGSWSDAEAAARAGSRIALDILEEGVARQHPRFFRDLLDVAMGVCALAPSAYLTRLARLSGGKGSQIFIDNIERSVSSGSLCERLSSRITLFLAAAYGDATARSLFENYWPHVDRDKITILEAIKKIIEPSLYAENSTGLARTEYLRLIEGLLCCTDSFELNFISLLHGVKLSAPELVAYPCVALIVSQYGGRGSRMTVNFVSGKARYKASLEILPLFKPNAKVGNLPDRVGLVLMPAYLGQRLIRTPNRMELATIVRELASNFDYLRRRRTEADLPWLLAACLGSASSQAALLDLANEIERGAFGDTNEWMAIEQDLELNGIDLLQTTLGNFANTTIDSRFVLRGVILSSYWLYHHDDARLPISGAILDFAERYQFESDCLMAVPSFVTIESSYEQKPLLELRHIPLLDRIVRGTGHGYYGGVVLDGFGEEVLNSQALVEFAELLGTSLTLSGHTIRQGEVSRIGRGFQRLVGDGRITFNSRSTRRLAIELFISGWKPSLLSKPVVIFEGGDTEDAAERAVLMFIFDLFDANHLPKMAAAVAKHGRLVSALTGIAIRKDLMPVERGLLILTTLAKIVSKDLWEQRSELEEGIKLLLDKQDSGLTERTIWVDELRFDGSGWEVLRAVATAPTSTN